MIRPCCKQDQIISYAHPEVQATLEVRPKIRLAGAPSTVIINAPVTLSAQEMRPVVGVRAPAPVLAGLKPTQTSAQELRPVIKKIEEE